MVRFRRIVNGLGVFILPILGSPTLADGTKHDSR